MEVKQDPRNMVWEDPMFLYKLQVEIESLTKWYDESSILKTLPDLVELMIRPDMPSAKDTIWKQDVSSAEMILLNRLGTYSLEGICIHVFSVTRRFWIYSC